MASLDYTRYLSRAAKHRKPSGISEMRKHLAAPSDSLVWLASGMPNPSTFPVKGLTITLDSGQAIQVEDGVLKEALQYGPTPGYRPLVAQLKEMTQRYHDPPRWHSSDLLVTLGCQDGLAKALEMTLDPGDPVIVQDPCYSDVLCILAPLTPRFVVAGSDEKGMCPKSLRAQLEALKERREPMPKVMYAVPNSCNPTGTRMDEARKKELYDLACKYDFLILEDDPYYHLQYDKTPAIPSFLRLDTEGRVLRFDSLSKVVSAGLRVGWVSGPPPLLERINWHMQASVLCPPGLSQVVVSKLLSAWGEDGFEAHVASLREFYRGQKDAMAAAAATHLTGLCEWTVPDGGIFMWFKVSGLADTTAMLTERAVGRDVVLVPGRDFAVDPSRPCQYMRAAFSCATPSQLEQGMRNLAVLIREELALQKTTS